MTVTYSKLERPAVSGDWGLGVDDILQPTEAIAFRRSGPGSLLDEVARTAYGEGDLMVEWLVGSVKFPDGVARQLAVQVAQKVCGAQLRA